MRRLPVDLMELELVMMSPGGCESEEIPYLDVQTGEIISVWEDDDEFAQTINQDPEVNRRNREAVDAFPDRYIEVPTLESADDNEMLRDFLDSDWTDDDQKRTRAADAYAGSVSRWKKALRDDETVIHAWHDFEQRALRRRMLEFLAEHGIEPVDAGGG